ncbi:MAG: UDP-N-acetylmuramoyl-tripeptide--D-alanyl-D-alanine ligase [Ignavibacteriales bacterium]|nr:UDP-N-acetylmuramoyl-tripeptide--D-alanyl-D-alanine ligase [Ignavibacteriales bacterium]
MNLTASDILKIKHIRAIDFNLKDRLVVSGVTIDSRTVQPGALFVALKGERVDGHNFVTKAVSAGARVVMIERRWALANEALLLSLPVPRLVVDDSVRGLGELARIHRSKFELPVLAIAGSNGKTTTKDMIAAVLGAKYSVLATEGNLNNHLGVPLTLFRLESTHEVAVVEIGTNHPGEITYLCEILLPTHGLITNVGHEHLEFFKTLAGVAKAEGELFDWLQTYRSKTGRIFLNGDDPYLSRWRRKLRKLMVYGFEASRPTVRGTSLALSSSACAIFSVRGRQRSSFSVTLATPGLHTALNALAAAAVGLSFRVPATGIQRALEQFHPSGKRMEVLHLDGVTVLNDTYNANPDSVRAALRTLVALKTRGKRIAVLADMLELGKTAEQLHRDIGREANRAGIQYLLTYGPLSAATHDASSALFKVHYDQKNVLAEYLSELVTGGDIVLVKGSRGMKMEDVVTFLKERLSKAA